MGLKGALVLFMMGTIMFCSLMASTDGRKLLTDVKHTNVPSTLYLTALPKGKVPASTPSRRGHAVAIDEKLIAGRHLAAIDRDRILRSVPSPGVGH